MGCAVLSRVELAGLRLGWLVCRAGLAVVASLCCAWQGWAAPHSYCLYTCLGKAYVPCLCRSVSVGENLDLRWRGLDWPAGRGVGLAVQGLGWLCWSLLGWSELVSAGLPVWAGVGLDGLRWPGFGLAGRRLLLCLLVCCCYC